MPHTALPLVRVYSKALAEACRGLLLLPESRRLEESKPEYMDKLAEEVRRQHSGLPFAVLTSLRARPRFDAIPIREPPPHVLEFCLAPNGGGLLDRPGWAGGGVGTLRRPGGWLSCNVASDPRS